MTTKKVFQIVDGPLSVRREPGTQWVGQIANGQQVEVEAESRRESGGSVWWKHGTGWSAEKSADGKKVYMTEVAAAPTASAGTSKKIFTVSEALSVRAEPGLNGKWITQLPAGLPLEVDSTSRREMDGYVWWKHPLGWSAEKALNGSKTYLIEAPAAATTSTTQPVTTAATQPAQPAAATVFSTSTVTVTTPSGKKKSWKVGNQEVRVRKEAGLRGGEVKWLAVGFQLECDEDSRCEVDGYVWWKHADGWTAERSVDGKSIFLLDPSAVVAVAAATSATPSGLPDASTLPMLNGVFKRFPVDLAQTQWWQYYGNNNFAYNLWAKGTTWYKYAQGLHGGVDFGNSSAQSVPIYAGVEGKFQYHDKQYTAPNGLWVTVGPYTVIFGHVKNPRTFNVGDPIGPDTVMGEIEFGGQNHLHLEVRYASRWIVNPLLLMTETMRSDILKKFPQGAKYFYADAGWNKWQTWNDQPVLILGGPLIGPHAR